jgi:hypothetical protein
MLIQNEEKGQEEKKREDTKDQAKNIETSFWMLLILILFFCLNLTFIYGGGRDIGRNNLKINYMKYIFNNTAVYDYKSLYQFIVEKIGFSFLNKGNYTNSTDDELYKLFGEEYVDTLQNALNNASYINFKPYTFEITIPTPPGAPPRPPQNHTVNLLETNRIYDYANNVSKSTVNFKLVSSIHVIMTKVVSKECRFENTVVAGLLTRTDKCYENYYSPKTAYKNLTFGRLDNIYKGDAILQNAFLENFTTFKEAEEAGINLDVI